jgi:hypothetical protein
VAVEAVLQLLEVLVDRELAVLAEVVAQAERLLQRTLEAVEAEEITLV